MSESNDVPYRQDMVAAGNVWFSGAATMDYGIPAGWYALEELANYMKRFYKSMAQSEGGGIVY